MDENGYGYRNIFKYLLKKYRGKPTKIMKYEKIIEILNDVNENGELDELIEMCEFEIASIKMHQQKTRKTRAKTTEVKEDELTDIIYDALYDGYMIIQDIIDESIALSGDETISRQKVIPRLNKLIKQGKVESTTVIVDDFNYPVKAYRRAVRR
jgi:hypothetical protein